LPTTGKTRKTISLALAAVLLALAGPVSAGFLSPGLSIQPARTRIGIAKVILQIDRLTVSNHSLDGDYFIRIPMAPFMDDRGSIHITLDQPLESAVTSGKTLTGSASSREDGRTHPVACTFLKNRKISIVVTTPSRVLSFQAPYELIP